MEGVRKTNMVSSYSKILPTTKYHPSKYLTMAQNELCTNVDKRLNTKLRKKNTNYTFLFYSFEACQVALVLKNRAANAGDIKSPSSIPGSRRSSGGGQGNSLQYSCLENPMVRGAWQPAIHGVT